MTPSRDLQIVQEWDLQNSKEVSLMNRLQYHKGIRKIVTLFKEMSVLHFNCT